MALIKPVNIDNDLKLGASFELCNYTFDSGMNFLHCLFVTEFGPLNFLLLLTKKLRMTMRPYHFKLSRSIEVC